MEDNSSGDETRESLETLDAPETSTEIGNPAEGAGDTPLASPDGAAGGGLAEPPGSGGQTAKPPKQPKRWLHSANLYLAGFILLVLVAVGLIVFAITKSGHPQTPQITSQNLSPQALKQLATSNTNIGSSNQLLTVQSNAIFTGQVLAQKSLEVAGDLKVGGNLSLPRVVVSGTSQFGSVQVNQDLSVAGNAAIQGALSINSSLSASGGGNFGGPISAPQVTANSLQLNGNLNLTHHISAGGGTPSISRGGAVGSGGSASLSGSDTAGSISINTGGSPPAGCFATVSFTQAFNATPHIIVTPIGSAAGGLQYYVTRSTTQFSVCTNNSAPAGANFGFDYIAFD